LFGYLVEARRHTSSGVTFLKKVEVMRNRNWPVYHCFYRSFAKPGLCKTGTVPDLHDLHGKKIKRREKIKALFCLVI
jgi:hypothetical protein